MVREYSWKDIFFLTASGCLTMAGIILMLSTEDPNWVTRFAAIAIIGCMLFLAEPWLDIENEVDKIWGKDYNPLDFLEQGIRKIENAFAKFFDTDDEKIKEIESEVIEDEQQEEEN